MVAKAKDELEQELADKEAEKERYLAENAPLLQMSGMSLAELQVHPQLIKHPHTTGININKFLTKTTTVLPKKYNMENYSIPKVLFKHQCILIVNKQ